MNTLRRSKILSHDCNRICELVYVDDSDDPVNRKENASMPRLPKTDHLPSLALLRSAAAWSLVVALHGAALANPAAAQPITAMQIADLAEMDALLRSDQAPADPQQPLGPPDPEPVSDVPAEDVYGPHPEETELVNEGDLAPVSPLPARTYASFGEDV